MALPYSPPVLDLGEESSGPEVAILFMGVSLVLGIISRQAFKGTRVPYTVALFLLGIALGVLEYGTSQGLGVLGNSIRMWANINPNLILFVFLPALLFESSFSMDVHQVKRCLLQMVLLAGPGVLISTFILGLANLYFFPYGWNWTTSFLLGGLLSATDPVAVVALLKDLGTSKKIGTIVEGESLINDGVAIVVFRLLLQMVLGQSFGAGETVAFLAQVALGAIALGSIIGAVSVLWVGISLNDTIIEITLTFTASYMAFFLAEDQAGVSGVLTVMTVGIFFAAFGRTAFTGESERSMHHFWEMVAYIANTLIFILSGTVIAESILRTYDNIEGRDWGYLMLLYAFVQVSRMLVVMVLYPVLRYSGYGLDWKEAAVLIWAGLRGAVALSLALSVAQLDTADSLISRQTQARFVFFTGGVVFLTLIVNGSTAQYLIKFLDLTRPSEAKARILEFVEKEMYSRAVHAFAELGDDEELGPADWAVVQQYLTCIRPGSEDKLPASPHGCATDLQLLLLQDARIRFLNGLQAAYWGMLEEGRITQAATILLMQSVNEALDEVARSNSPINDWKGIATYVHFPQHYKYVQRRNTHLAWLPDGLTSFILVQRLELACYISGAFLRGHRLARLQLNEFLGETSLAVTVLKESEAQEAPAQTFLEDVRIIFPQVLRVLKNRQITRATLQHLSSYVQNLEHCGLLEGKETAELQHNVEMSVKKLLRSPPLVKIPKPLERLTVQPFLGALPEHIQQSLLNSAQEYMRLRQAIIYMQGSKPDGIWLIANGVVKWCREEIADQYLVNPTFLHGTTLGLYEVLTGRPRLCRIVTATGAHCFFIERDKLLSAMKSDPELETFFWMESALVVAKLVFPKLLQSVTIQELRGLVSATGKLHHFVSGEYFELKHGELGVLLEGFVRRDKEESTSAAPSGLTPEAGGFRPTAFESGTHYVAETRSQVLVFRSEADSYRGLARNGRPQSYPWIDSERAGLVRSGSNILASDTSAAAGPRQGSSGYLRRAAELGVFGSQEKILESRRGSDLLGEEIYLRHPSGSSLVKKVMSVESTQVRQLVERLQSAEASEGKYSASDLAQPLLRPKRAKRADDSAEASDDEEDRVEVVSASDLLEHLRFGFTPNPL